MINYACTNFGDHAFSVTMPLVWNSLSLPSLLLQLIDSHTEFCRHLKTYLFKTHLTVNIFMPPLTVRSRDIVLSSPSSYPSGNICFVQRGISVLSGGISVILTTNVQHVSRHC